jgi:DNA-binding Lrp family transcriptional regulator
VGQPLDEKAGKVLRAIRRKVRPYQDADVAMASGLSKAVVRRRCQQLEAAGLIRERWYGARGPFWEPAEAVATQREAGHR